MRGVVWLVVLFTVAVVAATTLGGNDGLVSIYWSGWRTDLSLNLFVLLLIGACVVLFFVMQAVHSIGSLPRRAQEWRDLRKERAAQAALREALAEHFGARYGRAVKAAGRALDLQRDNPQLRADAEFAALVRLVAAASLHRLQDRRRRDEWLAPALAPGPDMRRSSRAEDALRLVAAEWALDDRDLLRAQGLLAELPAGVARRTQALRLKLQASRAAGDHLQALHTARLLANHGAFSALAAAGLLRALAGEALEGAQDLGQLQRVWDQFDAADRLDPLVAARAAHRASALAEALAAGKGTGDDAEAKAAIEAGRQWLRPFWDRIDELDGEQRQQVSLALIAVSRGIGHDWLPRLEAAQQQQGQHAAVLAAVGHAFADRQLWGKARRLLEAAAESALLPRALRRRSWRRLAELARMESDEPRAQRCEQAAAAIE
jgi:HemY protein